MKIKQVILAIFALFLSGCGTLDFLASKAGYENKQKIELKIDELKKDREKALDEQEKRIRAADLALLNQTKDNFQKTSNWLYGAYLGSEMISNKDRLDNLINYRLVTAISYAPPPTPEAIMEQNKLLKEELNETKVSNKELEARYAAKEKEAKEARDREVARAKDVENAEKEKVAIEKSFSSKIEAKNDELRGVNDNLFALKEKQLENERESNNLKKYMIGILFAGAGLCAVGAYLMRSLQLAIVAIALGGAALAIPFIKTWMVITAISLILTIAGIIVYKQLHDEKTIANNAVGAIQEVRNENEAIYKEKIKPKLNDWFKDKKHLTKKVEQKLVELNQK